MIEIVHYQVNDLVNMLKKPCDPREAASLMCPGLRRVDWMSAQVVAEGRHGCFAVGAVHAVRVFRGRSWAILSNEQVFPHFGPDGLNAGYDYEMINGGGRIRQKIISLPFLFQRILLVHDLSKGKDQETS